MKINDFITEAEKVRLDPKCWTGKKIGNPKTKVKGGVRVNNCVPAESVNEMDKSQPGHGRDGKISHSTYGSRDRDGSSGQEHTAKISTADRMMKDAHDAMMRSMSDADKVKKGWRNPNMKKGVAEGPGFNKWADERAASQLHKLNITKTWEVSYDYGPHMTKSVTVKARSEEEARAKVEKAAEKKGLSIMINSVEPAEQGMAEGYQQGEYSRVLTALKLYYPDKFSMEELNTPEWHRVIANKAGVPVEYAGQVIDDFTKPIDPHEFDEFDDEQGMAEDYNPEYDDEAGMADNNLETLARAVEGIDDVISAGDNLPEWCQEKIAVAKSMLVAVWDYMKSEENIEQGVAEGLGLYGPFTVTINTGERPQSRTKTKKFRREDDAILWAQDWLEDAPQYVFATAQVTDPEGNVVWTTDESLEEVSLDLAKRARDKAEHMVDMDYDDMRDKPYGHSEKQRIKFQRYIDKKEPRAKGDRDWSPPEHGVSEGICSIQEANAIFDDFERSVAARGLAEDIFDSITDEEIIAETAAWRRKEGKSKSGGLNAKGVASYRRENPGSKLQMAVTTKPSKLKKGSKAAKRRKSFCARMSGVKGPMKKPNGKPTRKALALRKWNC